MARRTALIQALMAPSKSFPSMERNAGKLNDRLRLQVIMHVEIVCDDPDHRSDAGVDEKLQPKPRARRRAGLAPRNHLLGFVLARDAEGQNGEQDCPPDDEIKREAECPVHNLLYHTSAVWTRTTGFLPQTSLAARRAAMRTCSVKSSAERGLPFRARSTASLTGAKTDSVTPSM